jgi:hypothetical protein
MKLAALFAAVVAAVTIGTGSLWAKENKVGPQDTGAPRIKLFGQIDVVNAACSAAGVALSSKQFPCKIEKVRMGSPAAYAGLSQNDKVLKASIEENKLSILIERGGQRYAVKLNTSRDPIVAQTTSSDKAAAVRTIDQATALKEISKYNIVLIVDRSGSMNSELGSDDSTKWEWCQNNISTFAREIAPMLDNNQLTLLFFDHEFTTIRNCTPNTVRRVFEELHPRGGTLMSAPMEAAFADYFKVRQGRPLLVVVLTDGLPGDASAVEKSIINATTRMADSSQLKVRFLEIGNDYSGGALLELVDDHLVSLGAKYDIVDYASFEEVEKLGLAKAMVAPVSPAKNKSRGVAGSMEMQLQSLRREIESLNNPTKQ